MDRVRVPGGRICTTVHHHACQSVHALLCTAVLPPLLTGATQLQRCGNAQHPLYDSFTWWTSHPNEWVGALANNADFSVSPPGHPRSGTCGQRLGQGSEHT